MFEKEMENLGRLENPGRNPYDIAAIEKLEQMGRKIDDRYKIWL